MAAAVMLGRRRSRGHRDRAGSRAAADLTPTTPSDGWDRRSVAQFGLAHWLHARGTSILREQLPAVYRRLDENGGYHFNFVKYLLAMMPDAEVTSDDDRFDLVTGRRSTIEWAMASAAREHPGSDGSTGRGGRRPAGDGRARRTTARHRCPPPARRGDRRRPRRRRDRPSFTDARLARGDRCAPAERARRGQRLRLLRSPLPGRRGFDARRDGATARTVRELLDPHPPRRQRHLGRDAVRAVRRQGAPELPAIPTCTTA